MIKWFIGLIVKSNKATDQQIDEAIGRLNEQEYNRGWEHAVYVWNTSPPRIARETLANQMGDIDRPFQKAIWDFLEARNGVR